MMYQRNVLASFDTRQQANLATQRLMQAGLGDVQLRIVPPPSAHQPDGRVVVSVVVDNNHADRAEQILGQYGHVDLVDEHLRGARHLQAGHARQDSDWRPEDRREQGQFRRWETQHWSRPRRGMMEDMPTGTMMAALTAVGAGLAFWYGMRQWSEGGETNRSRDQNWRGLTSRHADRRSITDEPGTGRQRLQEWREHGATEGIETGRGSRGMADRERGSGMTQGARSYASQGLAPNQDDSGYGASRDTSRSRGTMQTGIGSGSGMTAGLSGGAPGTNVGAGSGSGAGLAGTPSRAGGLDTAASSGRGSAGRVPGASHIAADDDNDDSARRSERAGA